MKITRLDGVETWVVQKRRFLLRWMWKGPFAYYDEDCIWRATKYLSLGEAKYAMRFVDGTKVKKELAYYDGITYNEECKDA